VRRAAVPAAAAIFAAGMVSTGLGVAAASAAGPGVTSNSITVGLITSLTGPAAQQYTGIVASAQARIDLQNAKGGVHGRKIHLIVEDDGTNPATNQTASQALIAKGVFGVIEQSAVTFGGSKVLQQAGVPVVGGAYDGPEWGQQPNTNMFSLRGSLDAHAPANTVTASFIKAHGGKVVGSLGYSISPSSISSATGFMYASEKLGLQKGYINTTLPFGSIAVTPLALQIRAAHVDSLYLPLDQNTNFAILTALRQAGVTLKVAVSATGYGQALLDDTSVLPDAQGTYFPAVGQPVELNTPATKAFQAALAKYAHYTGVPGFDWYEGWASTDLMIEGLELAGKNPTQSAFITNLHKVTHYSANGLLNPVSMSLKYFGKDQPSTCGWEVQLRGSKFVPVPSNGKATCGKDLPNSNQLS
jgi:branched-chain amino acid transport system substrate-binding protein